MAIYDTPMRRPRCFVFDLPLKLRNSRKGLLTFNRILFFSVLRQSGYYFRFLEVAQ